MPSFDRKKIIYIFLLALAVRLAFFVVFGWHFNNYNFTVGGGDSYAYAQIGHNIFAGNGFSESTQYPFVAEGGRLPVVPFIIGLFGEHRIWYLIFQVLIASVSVVILYTVAARIFGEATALWSAILYALSPLSGFHSINLLTETWFTFFFLLSIYFIVNFWNSCERKPVVAAAFFLGIAALTRPVASLFPILVVAVIWFFMKAAWQRKLAASFLFLVVFGLTVSPWLVRNQDRFAAFGLSYIPAYNFYFYNAREYYAQNHNLTKNDAKQLFRKWKAEAIAADPTLTNELRLQSFYMAKGRELIGEDPLGYLKFHLLNTGAVYLNTGYDDIYKAWTGDGRNVSVTSFLVRGWSGLSDLARQHPLELTAKSILLVLYAVIGIGTLLALSQREMRGYFLFFLATALFLGITTGAVAEPRFRVPAEPFLLSLFFHSAYLIMRGPSFSLADEASKITTLS